MNSSDEKALAIEQRVERQGMQDVVGHDDQRSAAEQVAQRRDERFVKRAKVRFASPACRRRSSAPVNGRPETELRQLELQQPQETPHLRNGSEGHDVEAIASDDATVDLPAGLVVLEQDRVRCEARTNVLDADRCAALKRGELLIGSAEVLQRSAQLFLEREDALSPALSAADGAFRPRGVLQFRLAIVPVQLLAEPLNRVGRTARDPRRERAGAERNRIGQAA